MARSRGLFGLGFIGAGGFAGCHGRAAAASGALEAVAAFDPAAGVAERFSREFGGEVAADIDALLADPRVEGVVAAVPNPEHERVVAACARAGKPVLVEKPLANTVAEGRRMVDACARAGVLLAVGHNTRRTAVARRAKALIDSGRLGAPLIFEGNFTHTGSRRLTDASWRAHRETCPGGPLNVLGIHVIDTLRYLLGPCESVSCVLSRVAAPVDMDDAAAAVLRMRSGAVAYVGAGYSSPSTNRYRVLGSLGNVECEGDAVTVKRDDPARPGAAGTVREELAPVDSVREELEEFARAARGERAYEVTGEVALAAVAVLEAALRSAAERREVRIDEVTG